MLGKGFLGLALVITDNAVASGLPLDPGTMMTEGGGQVRGASGGRVKTILARHGIDRRLSSEGGRTSRGTPAKAQAYVAFLNDRFGDPAFDLDDLMSFWIDRVRDYFAAQPFILELDASVGVRGAIRRLLDKVEARQKETPGATLVGTVVQHLIGAKLETVLKLEPGALARHGASVNDAHGRGGDIEHGDTVIHVTTAPGALLIEKCLNNLAAGKRPWIVTGRNRIAAAEGMIEDAGVALRVDLFDYEQFLAANVFELGGFEDAGRRNAFAMIIERYNMIIDAVETDPGLKIELR